MKSGSRSAGGGREGYVGGQGSRARSYLSVEAFSAPPRLLQGAGQGSGVPGPEVIGSRAFRPNHSGLRDSSFLLGVFHPELSLGAVHQLVVESCSCQLGRVNPLAYSALALNRLER